MKAFLLGYLAGGFLRLYLVCLRLTSRLTRVGQPLDVPAVYAVWHGRLMLMPLLLKRAQRKRTIVLTSWHADGQLVGYVARSFGFRVIHGSSSSGGRQAARALVQALVEGYNVLITPDAPPQPAFHCAPGAERIAEMAKVPLVSVATHASRVKILNTKDKFTIPLPFGRIRLTYTVVPPTKDALAKALKKEI